MNKQEELKELEAVASKRFSQLSNVLDKIKNIESDMKKNNDRDFLKKQVVRILANHLENEHEDEIYISTFLTPNDFLTTHVNELYFYGHRFKTLGDGDSKNYKNFAEQILDYINSKD